MNDGTPTINLSPETIAYMNEMARKAESEKLKNDFAQGKAGVDPLMAKELVDKGFLDEASKLLGGLNKDNMATVITLAVDKYKLRAEMEEKLSKKEATPTSQTAAVPPAYQQGININTNINNNPADEVFDAGKKEHWERLNNVPETTKLALKAFL